MEANRASWQQTASVTALRPVAQELRIPQLSGALAELMAMSEEDRMDFNKLGRLVSQDPVALARLLALANSPAMGLNRQAGSVHDALMLMGAQRVCDALFVAWTLGCVEPVPALALPTAQLVKHTLSMAGTVRRIILYAHLSDTVDRHALTLVTLVNRLSLALLLTPQAPVAPRNCLCASLAEGRVLFTQMADLRSTLQQGALIGSSWGLPAALRTLLSHVQDPSSDSIERAILEVAELALFQRVHADAVDLSALTPAACALLERLEEKNAKLDSTVTMY